MSVEYTDFKCPTKDDNNALIVRWVDDHLGKGPFHALVLDGPLVGTSKAFIAGGVSIPSMIYAPQFNADDAKKMERAKKCVTIRATLSQVIRGDLKRGIPQRVISDIAVFNLDFMGSIFGRRAAGSKCEVYPLSDFHDCLANTEREKVIISITVSERMGKKLSRDDMYFEGREGNFGKQVHKDFLIPIANFNQYRVVCTKRKRYRRIARTKTESGTAAMWFFIYCLRKDLSIDPETVDFARSPFDEKVFWGFNPKFDDSWASTV